MTNNVKDWNRLQGLSHPYARTFYPHKTMNYRHISLENDSGKDLYFKISGGEVLSEKKYLLKAYSSLDIGVNCSSGSPQFITVYDTNDRELIEPFSITSNSNQYVIKEGLNSLWIHRFQRAAY